jgi:TolA-binding protein
MVRNEGDINVHGGYYRMRSYTKYVALCIVAGLLTCLPLAGACTTREDADIACRTAGSQAVIGENAAAVAAWQKILTDFGDQPGVCANAHLAIGRAYVSLGQTSSAEQEFNSLIAAYPGYRQSADATLELGKILESGKKYTEALALYPNILRDFSGMTSQCAEAKLHMAACHATFGDSDKQLQDLLELIRDYPQEYEKCSEARIRIGLIGISRGQLSDAIAQFQYVVSDYELDLWRAEALLWLGSTQQQAGLSTEALASYGTVICRYQASRPQRLKAMVARAGILEQQGRLAEALAQNGDIIWTYPSFRRQADAAKVRMMDLLTSSDIPDDKASEAREAIAHYDEVRDLSVLDSSYQDLTEKSGVDPAYPRLRTDCIQSIVNAGCAFRALGRYTEAEEQFQRFLKDYDDTELLRAQAKLELGKTQWKAGRTSDALATLAGLINKLPKADAECEEAFFARGQIYEQLKQYDAAVLEYRSVRANYPDSITMCFKATDACANLLLSKGDYNDALAEIDSVISRYSPQGQYYVPLTLEKGQILFGAKRYDECVAALQQLLVVRPEVNALGREARMLLVQALLESG